VSAAQAAQDGTDAATEDARRALRGTSLIWHRTSAHLPADPELRRAWLAAYAYQLNQALPAQEGAPS